jgi:toxin ParE1/3/4
LRIRWTERAVRNLDAVEAFIAQDDPEAAVRTVVTVVHAVERLAGLPNLGRPGRVPATRELVIAGTPFLVPYRVRRKVIEILGVFHGAMKWPAEI